jgi:hypothetical protein
MNDLSASACASREAPWVIVLGVFVGVSAISLSLAGLLGRLTAASVASCLLAALAASVLLARGSGAARLPRLVWMALPLLVPSALAALFLPPHTWDEVAYGAALPRDFARAGRLFYNADYGAYAAFPANYEALVTASLLLTSDVRITQLLNVVLALGMAVIAVLLARALGAARPASLLAGLFVLCAPAVIEVAPLHSSSRSPYWFSSNASAFRPPPSPEHSWVCRLASSTAPCTSCSLSPRSRSC